MPTDLTLPEKLDFQLKHHPDWPVYVFSPDHTEETSTISFRDLAGASHRAAYLLRPLGTGHEGQVVAVMALADTCVYQATVLGLLRAGLVPLLMSPRNSVPAVINLLKKTSCHRIITTKETLDSLLQNIVSTLKATDPDHELSIEEIPSLQALYPTIAKETDKNMFNTYPELRFAPNDIAIYFHSSGSTGLPKPIPLTHQYLIYHADFPAITHTAARKFQVSGNSLPPFHLYGFIVQVFYPIFGHIRISIFPPVVYKQGDLPMSLTPELILEHAVRTKTDVLLGVPMILEAWAQSPSAVETLKTFPWVISGAGPLSSKIGNFLRSQGVNLKIGYGVTEVGAPVLPFSRPGDEEEWEYMEFTDRVKMRWVPHGNDLYESQFLTCDTHCLAVENLPDVAGYTPSDLWVRHPTKHYLWKIVGRMDDVIVHSSGEKTVTTQLELTIMQSPLVEGAVVFGHGYAQPGVLIQPHPNEVIDTGDPKQVSELRNKLWSAVQEANQVASASSRIFKELILITSPSKPLIRTAKGGILRRAAIQAYENEIQDLYKTVESYSKLDSVGLLESWTTEDLCSWLLAQAHDVVPNTHFSPSVDLFHQGFDSLSATIFRLRIVSALQASLEESDARKAVASVTQNIIYSYPTIDSLSTFLHDLVKNPGSTTNGVKSHEILINEMIDKHSVGLDVPLQANTETISNRPVIVLLTGSTGNLGSHLLASLLANPTIHQVFALNRPSSKLSIYDRHVNRFHDIGLDTALLSSDKLVMIETDMAQTKLSVGDQIYTQLQNSVTMIIHNAWPLDFNMTLSSFEPNIRATRNLIDLGRTCANASSLRFLFTCSVGIAVSWDRSLGAYPEKVVEDVKYAVGGGYGEAKYIAERLLTMSGLESSSLRIGQITGAPPTGAWALTDWVPILIKSSLDMRVLPDFEESVTWISAKVVSDSIIDIAFSKQRLPPAANIVHPRPVSWHSVFQDFRNSLVRYKGLPEDALKIVPFAQWVTKLTECAQSATEKETEKIPAIKLLDFFKRFVSEKSGTLAFDTAISQSYSPTLKDSDVIGSDLVDLWVKYWIKHGL